MAVGQGSDDTGPWAAGAQLPRLQFNWRFLLFVVGAVATNVLVVEPLVFGRRVIAPNKVVSA